jgi:uncharacterized phage-like protein YoqJ
MIVALTGHRPEKAEPEDVVREKVRLALRGPENPVVVCGMAAGFDLWAGTTALRMGLEVIAAKPWKGHKARKADEQLYAEVFEGATRVVNVSDSETYLGPWLYHDRNEWMVDNATHVLAYWDGGEKGGTAACVRYAKKVGKPIRNIYA